jgi:hypothetical protein
MRIPCKPIPENSDLRPKPICDASARHGYLAILCGSAPENDRVALAFGGTATTRAALFLAPSEPLLESPLLNKHQKPEWIQKG